MDHQPLSPDQIGAPFGFPLQPEPPSWTPGSWVHLPEHTHQSCANCGSFFGRSWGGERVLKLHLDSICKALPVTWQWHSWTLEISGVLGMHPTCNEHAQKHCVIGKSCAVSLTSDSFSDSSSPLTPSSTKEPTSQLYPQHISMPDWITSMRSRPDDILSLTCPQ